MYLLRNATQYTLVLEQHIKLTNRFVKKKQQKQHNMVVKEMEQKFKL